MIAREGFIFIVIGLFVTAAFLFTAVRYDSKITFSLSVLFGILTLFTSFFFRDPHRKVEYQPNLILSPADGKVLKIEELDNHEYIGGPTIKISIFLSVFDVHINRLPASGRIDHVEYIPGKYLVAFADKASEINERTEFGMTTENGYKVFFKQIAGSIARRIVYYLNVGDEVNGGDRFGLIRFGSRMEVFISKDFTLRVKVDDKVKGGLTVLAEMKNETQNEKDR